MCTLWAGSGLSPGTIDISCLVKFSWASKWVRKFERKNFRQNASLKDISWVFSLWVFVFVWLGFFLKKTVLTDILQCIFCKYLYLLQYTQLRMEVCAHTHSLGDRSGKTRPAHLHQGWIFCHWLCAPRTTLEIIVAFHLAQVEVLYFKMLFLTQIILSCLLLSLSSPPPSILRYWIVPAFSGFSSWFIKVIAISWISLDSLQWKILTSPSKDSWKLLKPAPLKSSCK